MIRGLATILGATILVFPFASAHAAEKGLIIRAGDLMEQPFIDAAKVGPVAASEPVTMVERRGGWVRVEAGGGTGWVRMLNVRLAASAGGPAANSPSAASLLRTGSSGRTVTTGIKGLGEEDIRNASADYAQLEQLGTLAVGAEETRQNAEKSQLRYNDVAYLKKGRGR
jgi:hypothetical protein